MVNEFFNTGFEQTISIAAVNTKAIIDRVYNGDDFEDIRSQNFDTYAFVPSGIVTAIGATVVIGAVSYKIDEVINEDNGIKRLKLIK